jgi:hypothetical protein
VDDQSGSDVCKAVMSEQECCTLEEDSPQKLALEWMTHADRQVELADLMSDDTPESSYQLLKAYSLIVLYYSLGLPASEFDGIKGFNPCREVGTCSRYRGTCLYPGVDCFYAGTVSQITMSTFTYLMQVSTNKFTNSYTFVFEESSNLNGTIPPEIGNLKELSYLKIELLTGSIPTQIGKLTKLRYLILSKCMVVIAHDESLIGHDATLDQNHSLTLWFVLLWFSKLYRIQRTSHWFYSNPDWESKGVRRC